MKLPVPHPKTLSIKTNALEMESLRRCEEVLRLGSQVEIVGPRHNRVTDMTSPFGDVERIGGEA